MNNYHAIRSSSSNSSDESLAQATAAGSIEAFDVLARRYQLPLVRFIGRRFPHSADAEDVCQETLVRAFRAIASFDAGRSFRAWIFAIALRQGVSAARRESVRKTRSLMDDDRLAGSPDIRPEDAETGGLWTLARRLLTGEQASALWLVHVEAMPIAEVAVVLGKTASAVKVMVHRARARVRDEWMRLSERERDAIA